MLPWSGLSHAAGSGGHYGQQQQQQQQQMGGQNGHSSAMQHTGNYGIAGQQQGGGGQQQQQQQYHPGAQQQLQLQQQQQQGQQGQQQQQQQAPPPPPQQPVTLASVLHYLQTEWRRYERERNEWEIERGEMRARIALLEGERRGTENLKTDLMRRVKMLEYALKQERGKYLTVSNANSQAQQQLAAIAQAQKDKKEKERLAREGREKEKEKEKEKDKDKEKEGVSSASKEGVSSASKEGDRELPKDPKAKIIKEDGKEGQSGRSSPIPESAGKDDKEPTQSKDASVPEVVVSSGGATTASKSADSTAPKLEGAATNAAPASPQVPISSLPPHVSGQPGANAAAIARPSSTASLTSLNNASSVSLASLKDQPPLAGSILGWNPNLGRDPRGRAKSREYLKQCLQEINYLTSITTLNPLPERTPGGLLRPRKNMVDMPVVSQAQLEQEKLEQEAKEKEAALATAAAGVVPIPAQTHGQSAVTAANIVVPLATPSHAAGTAEAASIPTQANNVTSLGPVDNARPAATAIAGPSPLAKEVLPEQSVSSSSTQAGQSDSSPLIPLSSLASPTTTNGQADTTSASGTSEDLSASQDAKSATAIFRPESSEEWRKVLKRAQASAAETEQGVETDSQRTHQAAQLYKDVQQQSSGSVRGRSDSMLSNASTIAGPGSDDHKLWKSRRALRAHLDATRCLAFDRAEGGGDLSFATGGDDCVVKWWRLPLSTVSASARGLSAPDSEATHTFRGHTGPVTSLAVSSTTNRIYSASLDATIGIWSVPDQSRENYAPFDARMNIARLEGHTDAVWDVCLLPSAPTSLPQSSSSSSGQGSTAYQANGASSTAPEPIREKIATASSDGTVKIWDVSPSSPPSNTSDDAEEGQHQQQDDRSSETGLASTSGLKLSWQAGGSDPPSSLTGDKKIIPTCLALCQSDITKIAVGYQDSIVRIFDIETGKYILSLKSNETYDGTPATQINRLVSHPTLPILITAHEDHYVRLFELKGGIFNCTHSFLAHAASVTSLDIDPSGLTLVTGAHDGSIRFWDILSPGPALAPAAGAAQTEGGSESSGRGCIQDISGAHRSKSDEGVLEVQFHPTLPFVGSVGADGGMRVFG